MGEGLSKLFKLDGPERTLALAREATTGRDIRISGVADVIQQYLSPGVVDELEIALVPMLFGGGGGFRAGPG
jgi:dihydrofolate reductase